MTSPLRTMIRDLHRRRGRERRGLALAEGVRLVEEALAARVPIRGAAVSPGLEATARGKALKSALEQAGVRLEPVSDAELAELADTEHPQGVVAVLEPPRWSLEDIAAAPGAPVLVLDAVQDPGNVGMMLRTTLGLGGSGVVALKGTADLANAKVMRGGMGAHFRLHELKLAGHRRLDAEILPLPGQALELRFGLAHTRFSRRELGAVVRLGVGHGGAEHLLDVRRDRARREGEDRPRLGHRAAADVVEHDPRLARGRAHPLGLRANALRVLVHRHR